MREPDDIDLPTRVKLASLVVHCEEMLSPRGHTFDREAVRTIVQDGGVRRWLASFDPVLLPVRR